MASALVMLVLLAATRDAAAGDVTGRWEIGPFTSGQTVQTDFVQLGSFVSTAGLLGETYSGSISSVTGAFNLNGSNPPHPICEGSTFVGTAAADGNSLTGTLKRAHGGLFCLVDEFAVTGIRLPPGCGDGVQSTSEECDDGNTTNGDGCSSTCRIENCGDGMRVGAEGCDDGNAARGDGCGPTCEVEACFQCDGGSPSLCMPTVTCPVCQRRPRGTCLRVAGTARPELRMKFSGAGLSERKLTWTWSKGAAFGLEDLGDPTTDTQYGICIYQPWDALPFVLFARAPAGGMCGTKPCWSIKKSVITYRDREGSPEGVDRLVLKGGADGTSSVRLRAKGGFLVPPLFWPLRDPVELRVQLQSGNPSGTTRTCFEATYGPGDVLVNDGKRFKAKGH